MNPSHFALQARDLVSTAALTRGFVRSKGLYFCRPRHGFEDVFFLDLLRPSHDAFKVAVGIHVPMIAPKLMALGNADLPSPILFGYLGQLSGGAQKWYRFKGSMDLNIAMDAMWTDFNVQAEPWLRKFNTIEEIAWAFYEQRLKENLVEGKMRRPDPIAWAIYGWLLAQSGKAEESHEWLNKAQDEVTKPIYVKRGRIYSEKIAGARQIPRADPEQRLKEILEKEIL